MPPQSFREELVALLNKGCTDNKFGTPDFILADFICDCLRAFDRKANSKLPMVTLPQINAHERRR